MNRAIRFILCAAALMLISVIFCMVIAAALSSDMDKLEWQKEKHTVQQGESLWTISKKYCPPGIDRRDWIAEIERLNGIHGYIYPGDTITVLVKK